VLVARGRQNDGFDPRRRYELKPLYWRANSRLSKVAQIGMGRFLYIGSLSKIDHAGLRNGILWTGQILISEVRALRRMMLVHPQGTISALLRLLSVFGVGHDALIARLHRNLR